MIDEKVISEVIIYLDSLKFQFIGSQPDNSGTYNFSSKTNFEFEW